MRCSLLLPLPLVAQEFHSVSELFQRLPTRDIRVALRDAKYAPLPYRSM